MQWICLYALWISQNLKMHSSFQFHSSCCKRQNFIFFINWVVFLSVCVGGCIFFIQSSVYGHMGWFHISATVSCAVINTVVQITLTSFHEDKFPGVGWPGLVANWLLDFWRTSILPPVIAVLVLFPAAVYLFSPKSSPTFTGFFCFFFLFLDNSHSNWADMTPHCDFIFVFFHWLVILSIFISL